MLFDLRGSGRRRTVKIVYVTLAILMGGGLVLFGIGGSGTLSGGLLDAITESDGSGDDSADRLATLENDAEAATRTNPQDAEAWAELARARWNLANSGGNVDQATLAFTREGTEVLRSAAAAWERHLELAGDNPNTDVARIMVQAYGGLNQLPDATTAQELVAEEVDSAGAYTTLAQIAYQAGQTRKGDLARDRALELTEPDMREALRGQLEQAKQDSVTQQIQEATENAPPASTPTPTPESE